MEKRNFSFFKELGHANFKEDGGGSLNINGSPAEMSGPASTDWKVCPTNPEIPGTEFGYSEKVLHSSNPGGIKPIKDQSDPERCIFAFDLLEASDNRSITIKVSDPTNRVDDEVEMKTLKGSYKNLKGTYQVDQIISQAAHFFTVQNPTGGFLTFIELADPGHYGRLSHTNTKTFDTFRFSFLTRV